MMEFIALTIKTKRWVSYCLYGFGGCSESASDEPVAVGLMMALGLGNQVGEKAGVVRGVWAKLLWAGPFQLA